IRKIRANPGLLQPGSDGQAHAGDPALCPSAIGLLAFRPLAAEIPWISQREIPWISQKEIPCISQKLPGPKARARCSPQAFNLGESPPPCPGGDLQRGYYQCAKRSGSDSATGLYSLSQSSR